MDASVIDGMLVKAKNDPRGKIRTRIIGSDVATLDWRTGGNAKKKWLNGIVIEEYLELIVQRSRSNSLLPRVHAMNTDFLKTLQKKG